MKEKTMAFLKKLCQKTKSLALDILGEFKTFDYKSFKRKEGWITFIKNKKMLFSSIAALVIIVTIPIAITGGNKNSTTGFNEIESESESESEIELLYENFCNTNTAGGKLGDAISRLILVPEVNIIPQDNGSYLIEISGTPRSNTPGLDAYDTIIVTYSAQSANGAFSFSSCRGKIAGQTLSINSSVWNMCLQASRYN